MIFIAGVSPKTRLIDKTPRLCPDCGLVRARRQRVDHYFSLFFIPLFRVRKGLEVVYCDRCDQPVTGTPRHAAQDSCGVCGRSLEKDHRFCPYCGQPR